MRVLMVCLGNICRSPLAEGILKRKSEELKLDWTVESAGIYDFHVGHPPHHLSQKVALANGIDISYQVARKFSPADIDRYDIIYPMANDVLEEIRIISGNAYDNNKIKLFLDELFPGEMKDVPDPYYSEENAYHDVFDVINKACDAIIKKNLTERSFQND